MSDWSDYEYLSALGLFSESMSVHDAKSESRNEVYGKIERKIDVPQPSVPEVSHESHWVVTWH